MTGPEAIIPVPVATVTIAPGTLALAAGESRQLAATARDAAGSPLEGRRIDWTITDLNVATVSGGGVVTAIARGTATIRATSEGKTGLAELTVTEGPVTPSGLLVAVYAGGAHTCGLTESGAAHCWGRGESGQLGVPPPATTCAVDAPPPFPCRLTPVAVGGGRTFTILAAGGAHTCGLTSDGTALCWGNNARGQLGDNSTTARSEPVAVATTLKFTRLDAGAEHTCALTGDGAAYCWGRNDRGQLGDGTTSSSSAPVRVVAEQAFQAISAGGFSIGHTCGITAGGDAYCWGDNERGQLGIGTTGVGAQPLPGAVTGGLKFVSVTAGLGRHTCARTGAGAAYCWGENTFGGLGDGTSSDRAVPTPVSGGLPFTHLVAGGFIGHTCGLAGNGKAYCWGENEVGAIGDGSVADRFTPTAVSGTRTWTVIDAGFRHTCGLSTDGSVYCWGSGRVGQLGNNSTAQKSVPTPIATPP